MNLLNGNIKPIYFKYLSAAFGSAMITSVYSLVDMAMVGQYQGPDGTAALAVVAPIWNIIYSLGLLMGIGGSVIFSTVKGQETRKSGNENEYFTAAIIGSVILAFVSWAAIIFFDKPILLFFGADSSLLSLAESYLTPVKVVIPLFLFNQMLAAFLRNDNHPELATAGVLAGGLFNVVGDYIFVFTFNMGIFGVGLATAVGSGISFAVMLDIIAPRFNDELLKKLLDIDDNLTLTLHMQTMDPVKAIKMLKGALTNIQKMKIEEQKKAVRSGYDMDILPTDIITYEKDTLELLDDLNTSNQKIIKMTFLITCYGRSKRALENITQRVSGIIQQANCNLRCMQYLQEQGLMASAPIGCNDVGIERNLTTKSAAVLVPFCTQELFMPAPAIYYGLNALSNNMIMADRKKLRTPNGVILGTPGSGKSFSAKREILSCFLMTKDDVIVCDPEGEYFALVGALNGQVVRLATNSKDYLNPMDIQLSHKNDREALKLKSDFIITLCDLIAGGKDGLENDEKGIIDTCIKHIYDRYFAEPKPENMPVLEDLYNALLKYEPKDVAPEMQKEAKQKAVRIANSLVLYVHGSQNYFNHRTNVDSHNRIMCFDIRDLGNQLKELGMLIVQDAVWNRVSQNRERKIATRYYCDEFHLLLKERQTAIYSVEIWKRFRKWGGIPTGLTQNVGDFLKSEEIEGILGNSDFVYLLNQNAKDQAILADKLGLSEKQLAHVTNSEPGSGLILFDNVVIPFVDKYPADTKTYAIMNTKPEESVKQEETD